MDPIHPNARTTPAVRTAIAASTEPSGVLAMRSGVSTETIRKWRKRGTDDVQDHSSRPQHLRWRASAEERAIVRELRRRTEFPLDDLTVTVRHVLPHLNRDAIDRILKAEGLNRLPPRPSTVPTRPTKRFRTDDLGFLHVDSKPLPKRQTADGERRKHYLHVASDRASRMVHLAGKDEENEACASAFLKEAVTAFPFTITHVLTDNGSCFSADAFEKTYRALGGEHRHTRPYTPKTNGMVECFNGRIGGFPQACLRIR